MSHAACGTALQGLLKDAHVEEENSSQENDSGDSDGGKHDAGEGGQEVSEGLEGGHQNGLANKEPDPDPV